MAFAMHAANDANAWHPLYCQAAQCVAWGRVQAQQGSDAAGFTWEFLNAAAALLKRDTSAALMCASVAVFTSG